MTTSQLWFNLLPVIASTITAFFSITNALLFTLVKIINPKTKDYNEAYVGGKAPTRKDLLGLKRNKNNTYWLEKDNSNKKLSVIDK